MKRAVVFDLDGTLLDTLDDLADSGNTTLEKMGFPTHDAEAYKFFIGDGVGMLVHRMLPKNHRDDATKAEITKVYRAEYGRRWNVKTRPYDGIDTLLDELAAREIRMGVLSNKPDEMTQKCVAALLPRWNFEAVLGHHDGIPRKPDPAGALEVLVKLDVAAEDVLYLGDTATDMETAVAANFTPVGVLWGFRGEDELRNAGAETILAHPIDLLELLV